MFLVTTGLKETLPANKKQKVLFAGEWCKLYSNKHLWSCYEHEVLPYHWDDRNKYYKDSLYINDIYEKYLLFLTTKLNNLHSTDYSSRYWRILIGPWLYWFIGIIYDRYSSIRDLLNSNINIDDTIILRSNSLDWIPNDMTTFSEYALDDPWNHYIYSEIIKYFKIINYQLVDKINKPNYIKSNIDIKKNTTYNIKTIITNISSLFLRKLIISYTTNKEYNNFLYKSHFFSKLLDPIPYLRYTAADVRIDIKIREKLNFNVTATTYENLLNFLIPIQIPFTYIEGYAKYKKIVLSKYPKNIKLIHTETQWSFNDEFKLWMAENAERKTKILISQHGGNMGSALCCQLEDHQIKISDQFYSWGWLKPNYKNVKRMPAIRLELRKKQIISKNNGDILCIIGELPRYTHHLFSATISGQMIYYINNLIKLFKLLSNNTEINFRIRPYPGSDVFKWSIVNRLEDLGLGKYIDYKKSDIVEALNESKLSISTTNTTTFLHTFAANYPTLLFWNPKYWEIRQTAKPYYDELNRVGILHYDAISAATIINKIHQNPVEWWTQQDIQKTKNNFCSEFAYTSDNYKNIWKKELKLL